MQIIIPMSGFGERFRRAGYTLPKPLIEIEGKPIIAHIIDLFPEEKNFLFICNEEHLHNPNYHMSEVLRQYCPTAQIIGIPPHKLGPIYAVEQASSFINLEEPTIVNYCDFTAFWDWTHFKQWLTKTRCDGAIPAYKGFHPHSLGSTNYAYMREQSGWLLDIQEKMPYTDNRMQEYASSGTYYFSSGQLMLEAFKDTIEQDLSVGNEYYVSLAYKPLLAKSARIAVYPLQHFMQWGTPEDVAEYEHWSNTFKQLLEQAPISSAQGSTIIPMAGLGQRFTNEGYTVSKPLIPVSGKPMILQAVYDLPPAKQYAFVLRENMPDYQFIIKKIKLCYKNTVIKTISEINDGQACTALLGVTALKESNPLIEEPITFGTCDNGVLYNIDSLNLLLSNPEVDVIVWGVRHHANAIRHPHMFGWIETEENGRIQSISVKTPLKNPQDDPIVLGTFTFRKNEYFQASVERLINRNGRINGEFYLDSCINDAIALGLRCYLFEVDSFISWGTPNDLRTFEYWQSCFHKWPRHPYRLENDRHLETKAVSTLEKQYQAVAPLLPGEWRA